MDYDQKDGPVENLTSIRILLSFVAHEDMEFYQMDVVTDFLLGDIEENIFMEQLEGFVDDSKPDFLCELITALHGLKQAPRRWFAKMGSFQMDEL